MYAHCIGLLMLGLSDDLGLTPLQIPQWLRTTPVDVEDLTRCCGQNQLNHREITKTLSQ